MEKNLEEYFRKKVIERGGLCWKFISPSQTGVPDRIVLFEGKAFFVELKNPNGKGVISKIQQSVAKILNTHDFEVFYIASKIEADQFLNNYLL